MSGNLSQYAWFFAKNKEWRARVTIWEPNFKTLRPNLSNDINQNMTLPFHSVINAYKDAMEFSKYSCFILVVQNGIFPDISL